VAYYYYFQLVASRIVLAHEVIRRSQVSYLPVVIISNGCATIYRSAASLSH